MKTRVLFSYTERDDGPIYFDCDGHSDYVNNMGYNDCCVAVSTLNVMLILHCQEYGIEPDICEDGHVRIIIEEGSPLLKEVFKAAERQFSWLSGRYKDYIKMY